MVAPIASRGLHAHLCQGRSILSISPSRNPAEQGNACIARILQPDLLFEIQPPLALFGLNTARDSGAHVNIGQPNSSASRAATCCPPARPVSLSASCNARMSGCGRSLLSENTRAAVLRLSEIAAARGRGGLNPILRNRPEEIRWLPTP